MTSTWISEKFKVGLVSVIIPTYNRAILLSETIESVFNQTYRPIECIVVDDGSTDDTKAMVDKLKMRENSQYRLIYISQKKAGAQIARNIGTMASSGEFIQYIDSDDLLYPNKLKQQVGYLQQHNDCDGVFGDWEVGSLEKREMIIAYQNENLVEQMLTGRCIHTLSFIMHRRIVERIGFWDINIKRNQEIDFQLRGVIAGGRFKYLPQLCGLWRSHNDIRIVNASTISDILNFYTKWEILLKQNNRFNTQLSNKIADLFMWLVSQNIRSSDKELVPLLKEAVRLNPQIEFNKSKKLKIAHRFLGINLALKLWLAKLRYLLT